MPRLVDRKRELRGISCCFTVGSWFHEEVALKLLGKVRLIKKTSFMGHIAYIEPLGQQCPGMSEPQLDLISMRRYANVLAEDAGKMKRTQVRHIGQRLQGHLLGVVRLQIVLCTPDGWGVPNLTGGVIQPLRYGEAATVQTDVTASLPVSDEKPEPENWRRGHARPRSKTDQRGYGWENEAKAAPIGASRWRSPAASQDQR
jgi:hypothetical protein